MTEFGENLFILLIAAAIGLIIQFYIIKGAVLSALVEFKNREEDKESNKNKP